MGILETMAYGKPVLATRAGGVPEVVADKKTGLYHVGHIVGFVKGISTLATNKTLSEKKLWAETLKPAQNALLRKRL